MTQEHKLDGTLKRQDGSIIARCSCGWASSHFTSLSASAAFQDHLDTCKDRESPK